MVLYFYIKPYRICWAVLNPPWAQVAGERGGLRATVAALLRLETSGSTERCVEVDKR